MTDQSQRVRDAIADALTQVLGDEKEWPISWVVVLESLDADGKRGLWTIPAPDMRYWQTLGLLDAARLQEWHHQGERGFA